MEVWSIPGQTASRNLTHVFNAILIWLTESERDRADSVPSGHPFAFGYAMKELNWFWSVHW